jgi:hypothetical protein
VFEEGQEEEKIRRRRNTSGHLSTVQLFVRGFTAIEISYWHETVLADELAWN